MAEEHELDLEGLKLDNEEPDETPNYKAPAEKSVSDIMSIDAEDESLVKYKQTLLAGIDTAPPPDDPRRVVVEKMFFVVEDRKDVEFDLVNLEKVKGTTMAVKEGISYRIKIQFKVQHEIVSGLRFHQAITRKGVAIDKQSYMVGSYGPKAESYFYLCPEDEVPKGMIARGKYKVKSKFVDDDKHVHLAWEWNFDIKKEWE